MEKDTPHITLFSIGATLWVIVVLAMLLSERKRVSWGTQDRSRNAMFTLLVFVLGMADILPRTPASRTTTQMPQAGGLLIRPSNAGTVGCLASPASSTPMGVSTFVRCSLDSGSTLWQARRC